MESVEVGSSCPVSADVRLMMSHSARTEPDNSPTEKQKKRKKKKGIRALCRRIGKAIMHHILCCNEYDIACSDPTDDQTDLSGLQWALSVDPCPSGIELPVNADPADLELSSVSDISNLELSPESDPEPSPVPGPSIMELMSVSDISSLELSPESDLEPSPVPGPSIMELMSVSDIFSLEPSPVPSFCSFELTPDVDPADPEPSPVPGPSTLDAEIPGPSALDAEIPGPSALYAEIPGPSALYAEIPGPSALDAEIPGPSSLDAEIPGPSTLYAEIPGPSALDAEIPGPSALYAEIPGPSALDAEIPGPSSLDAEIPGPSALYAEIPGPSALDAEIPGPSSLDAEIPGPSGLGPAFVFDLWFVEKRRKKAICALLHRRWRAVKRSVRRFQMCNKVAADSFADEPVAHQDPTDQTDPEPSPVPGPSALDAEIPGPSSLDAEIPGPSGLGPAFVFDLWFVEKRRKKAICALLHRRWRAVKRSVRRFQMCNKVAADSFADEPVAHQDPTDQTDPEPSPVPGPSALDSEIPGPSGLGAAFEKQKKSICALFRRKWRAVKRSVRRFQRGNKVAPDSFADEPVAHQDPADLLRQTDPQPSSVSSPSTMDSGITPAVANPGPSYYKWTSDPHPDDPGPSPVPGPSTLVPVAKQDQADSVSLDSQLTLDSGPSDLVSELSVLRPSSREETSVSSLSSSSSVELTPEVGLADPEPKPVPGAIDVGPSGFWPATGSISSYYEVKRELGRGGFGIVCEGMRRFDGQKVAIKFLPKCSWDKFIELPGSTKPLLAEVAVNLLMRKPPKSPHVVQMFDWFDQPEQYALILEYPHPCETLVRFTMRKGGFLEEPVARGLMRQAVLAAKLCIDRGVYHKDIKTDNILVNTETLQLKFIDFGCSELFKTSKGHDWVVESTVWSLGRVLLEIVSGDQPSARVLQSKKLVPLRPSLSKECQDLIMQCLDKYRSMSLTLEQMLEHAWFEQE